MTKKFTLVFYGLVRDWQVQNALIIIESLKNAFVEVCAIYICVGENARVFAEHNFLETVIDESLNWPPKLKSANRLANLITEKTDEDAILILFYDRMFDPSIIYPFLVSRICSAFLICYQHSENKSIEYSFSYALGWIKHNNIPHATRALSIVKENVKLLRNLISISIKFYWVLDFRVLNKLRCQFLWPSYGALADLVLVFNCLNKSSRSEYPAHYHVVGSLVKERALIFQPLPLATTEYPSILQPARYTGNILVYSTGVFRSDNVEAMTLGRRFIECIISVTKELGLNLVIKCKAAEEDELLRISTDLNVDFQFSNTISRLNKVYSLIVLPVDSVLCLEASIVGINYSTYNIWGGRGMIAEANCSNQVPNIYEKNSSDSCVRTGILSLLKNQSNKSYPGGCISRESMTPIVGKSWPRTSSKIVDIILKSQLA